jgi:hypothetical protein
VTKEKTARPWKSDELKRAVEMRESGLLLSEIAVLIGRTEKAVRHKLGYATFSPEQLKQRAARAKEYRALCGLGGGNRVHSNGWDKVSTRPSDDLIKDRDARQSLRPRDLTAAFFGDPPVGYSALERRA